MNRKLFVFAIVLMLVFLIGCSNKTRTNYETSTDSTGVKTDSIDVTGTETTGSLTGEVVEFSMTAKRWDFQPSTIKVNKGDKVRLNIESKDVIHGFSISTFRVNSRLYPGKTTAVEFIADKTGTFPFFCSVSCGAGHFGMKGKLIVE